MTEEPTNVTESSTVDGGSGGKEQRIDYLDEEVNILRPSTPFMRAKLRAIALLFVIWLLFVFGPVTISLFAEEFMVETQVLGGYPLLYFMTVLVAPGAALVLAAIYAWYHDKLDDRYAAEETVDVDADRATAADGGVE